MDFKRYNDYASSLYLKFGERVQKISINAGFSCPNRDGKKGFGGCTFCNNQTFSPQYCQPQKSVTQQMNEGINFFRHKYKSQKYLAYFQSYTNTYAPVQTLLSLYSESLNVNGCEGIVIGTRPDCINNELLKELQSINSKKYVMIEYGIESSHDSTLNFINRHHTFQDAVNAIELTKEYGIDVGAHIILGLPNENEEMMMVTAKRISKLSIDVLKIHQLQLIKNTEMENQFSQNPSIFNFLNSPEEYIDLVIRFLEYLNPNISIERFVSQSPIDLLILPKWKIKNFEFTDMLKKRLEVLNSWQGKNYKKN